MRPQKQTLKFSFVASSLSAFFFFNVLRRNICVKYCTKTDSCSHQATFVPLSNNGWHQYECHPTDIKIKYSSSHHKEKYKHSQRRWFTHSFICISHKSISLHCIASKQIKNESSIHTVSCKGAFCTVWVVFTVYLHAICYRPGALQAALTTVRIPCCVIAKPKFGAAILCSPRADTSPGEAATRYDEGRLERPGRFLTRTKGITDFHQWSGGSV